MPEAVSRRRNIRFTRLLWLPVAWLVLLSSHLQAALPAISFTADEIQWKEQRLSQLALDCESGDESRLALDCSAALNGQSLTLQLAVGGQFVDIAVQFSRDELSALAQQFALPDEIHWITGGDFDLGVRLDLDARRNKIAALAIELEQFSFDSPDGLYAAEGVQASANVIRGSDGERTVRTSVRLNQGEMLLQDLYLSFNQSPLKLDGGGIWPENGQSELDLHLRDDDALDLRATARQQRGEPWQAWDIHVERLALNFPQAYERYVQGVLAPYGLDGLTASGSVIWQGDVNHGAVMSRHLSLQDVSIVDVAQSRFAVTGLNGLLDAEDASDATNLSWQGLLIKRINLGAAQTRLVSGPDSFFLGRPLKLSVMGGTVDINQFAVVLPGAVSGPDFKFSADVAGLQMQQVTAALGWPEFAGEISGHIPSVQYDEGIIDVDGELAFRVFDGEIAVSDLRVERPFGVLPSLAADIQLRDLDLEEITRTFSFGFISGRLEGRVSELRMLDWQPVSFDGWLGTPVTQTQSNDISRQAVDNLTTIGGGNATAALTGPILRLFSRFSYKRLGLGCRLHNNVCTVSGLKDKDEAVVILEGSGIPRVSIRAFNRSMDWPQMVANLSAVSDKEEIRIDH